MSNADQIAVLQGAHGRLRLIIQTLGEAFPKRAFVRLRSSSTKSAFRHEAGIGRSLSLLIARL
jgi:hypothetical protein